MSLSLYDFTFYLLLFLYSLDFLGMGNYLIIIWILLTLLLRRNRKLFISVEARTLLLFGIIYTVSYMILFSLDQQTIIRILIAPFLGYVVAENYYRERGKIEDGILIISFGMFLHAFLNMVLTIQSGYTVGHVINIWGGDIAQTLLGMLMTPMAGLLYYGIEKAKEKKLMILIAVCSALSFYFSLITGRRTLVIIFIILLIANILRNMIINHKIANVFRLLGAVVVVGVAFMIIYNNNIWGVKSFY